MLDYYAGDGAASQSNTNELPETTTERVAVVVLCLADGGKLTTAEVAELAGVSWHGAELMLERASRVVPIVKAGGVWQRHP